MSYCNDCNNDPCVGCGTGSHTQVWQPSTTMQRACEIIHALLASGGCECDKKECPDWELCRLIRFECDLCQGKYPLAVLAMLTAGKLLQVEAAQYARKGSLKKLTFTSDFTKTSDQLQKLAKEWIDYALKCGEPEPVYFAYAGLSKGCITVDNVFNHCSCDIKPKPMDKQHIYGCNFDCCEECD